MDSPLKNGRHHGQNGVEGNDRLPKKPKLSVPITSAEIADEFAHHDPSVARINNGSFGSCPSSVLSAQSAWQRLFLRQPDQFYFDRLRPAILRSRLAIRDLISADDVEEVSIVDNATTAAAIVLQQVSWAFTEGRFDKGDAVVMLHYAYGAVHLPFPIKSEAEIVSEFKKALEKGRSNGRKVRLAVIDHITSMPCVVIPVKELVRICREEGVDQVFVDAAHAIGNVEVNVKTLWFFCPPSIAFLYSRKSRSTDLHHPVVSHEYGNGIADESAWIGTRDYSAQLVVPEVVDFVNRFEGGIEGIRRRNHEEVMKMGEMLVDAWKTCLGAPKEMCSSMAMVGLPACLKITCEGDTMRLRRYLREKFGVEVPIYYRAPREGDNDDEVSRITGYARISHQVYNVVEDYHRFRDAVNQLVRKAITCELLPDN
ncbi:hypothetical protein QJS10_CPB04g01102 [Acorus calamus]|uniref:Aminotransferase class V domain-containing protein n=1 Tax=Acorus calamus TaxID=4465 RepID=A0AAV9EYZ5_ACOCL|nr:hypothetical protein QJS10_CPB04g01102 [Acorus calamus]